MAITIIAAALFLSGIVLILLALFKLRSDEKMPGPGFSPSKWKPIWKMQSYFTNTGFIIHLIGWMIVILTGVIYSFRETIGI